MSLLDITVNFNVILVVHWPISKNGSDLQNRLRTRLVPRKHFRVSTINEVVLKLMEYNNNYFVTAKILFIFLNNHSIVLADVAFL